MSIPIDKIYCKHWLSEADIELTYKFPRYYIEPHMAMDLRDSIHYWALVNQDFSTYDQLITRTKQLEHSIDTFVRLHEEFCLEKMLPIQIRYEPKIEKYVILDGVHRACILLYKGIVKDRFPVQFLNIV